MTGDVQNDVLYAYDAVSLNLFLRENSLRQVAEEVESQILCSIPFFPKIVPLTR